MMILIVPTLSNMLAKVFFSFSFWDLIFCWHTRIWEMLKIKTFILRNIIKEKVYLRVLQNAKNILKGRQLTLFLAALFSGS